MAINILYISTPGELETGKPEPIAISIENDTASDITISGISVVDGTGIITGGAFIPCFPVAENVYSVGTPELNPIPAWGTPEQSSENISGDPLIYFPANLSGVAYVPAVEGINYASGSYGGQANSIPAPSDPLISTSVVIPAGETCYYATQILTLTQGSLSQPLPDQVELYGHFNVLVKVEGQIKPLEAGEQEPYIFTGTSVGLSVVPVGLKGSTNVLVGGGADIINLYQYGRNPQYADFDFPLRAILSIDDGRQIDVTAVCTFTSSNEDIITVVEGESAYGTEETSVVGSSPRITGGGGACSLVPISAPTFSPEYSTLEATCSSQGGLTASTSVGLIRKLPVAFQVTQQLPIVARYAAGQGNLDCFPVIIYEDGYVEDETGGGYVLMEFDAATNQGDGVTGGICRWDDQDYGYWYVNEPQTVDTNTFIKVTWIDTGYELLMSLPPIYVPITVKAN